MHKLTWNVYRENFNNREIVKYNIFDHPSFSAEVKKIMKETNKEAFAEKLKRELMYYFWSKCEHEVVVTSWPVYVDNEELNRINKEREDDAKKFGREPCRMNITPTIGSKVDIYSQVMLNWDIFVDYVWNNREKK